jgi:hypothetical protein
MALPRSYLSKQMEFRRARPAEELVPGIRPESRDAREPSFYTAEIDRAKNSREISAERVHHGIALAVWLDTDNQKYRRAREWRKNRLRNRC